MLIALPGTVMANWCFQYFYCIVSSLLVTGCDLYFTLILLSAYTLHTWYTIWRGCDFFSSVGVWCFGLTVGLTGLDDLVFFAYQKHVFVFIFVLIQSLSFGYHVYFYSELYFFLYPFVVFMFAEVCLGSGVISLCL